MRSILDRRTESRRRRKRQALAELDMRAFQETRNALGRAVLRSTRPVA